VAESAAKELSRPLAGDGCFWATAGAQTGEHTGAFIPKASLRLRAIRGTDASVPLPR
jgi:hypothetical protein